jgi:hypothetical protein
MTYTWPKKYGHYSAVISTDGKSHLNVSFLYFCQPLLDMTSTFSSTQYSWSYHQHVSKQNSARDSAHLLQTVSQWNVLFRYSRQLPAFKINYTNINSNTELKGCTIIINKITIFAYIIDSILVCFLTPCICLRSTLHGSAIIGYEVVSYLGWKLPTYSKRLKICVFWLLIGGAKSNSLASKINTWHPWALLCVLKDNRGRLQLQLG